MDIFEIHTIKYMNSAVALHFSEWPTLSIVRRFIDPIFSLFNIYFSFIIGLTWVATYALMGEGNSMQ